MPFVCLCIEHGACAGPRKVRLLLLPLLTCDDEQLWLERWDACVRVKWNCGKHDKNRVSALKSVLLVNHLGGEGGSGTRGLEGLAVFVPTPDLAADTMVSKLGTGRGGHDGLAPPGAPSSPIVNMHEIFLLSIFSSLLPFVTLRMHPP